MTSYRVARVNWPGLFCRKGQFRNAIDRYYSPDIVSVEEFYQGA